MRARSRRGRWLVLAVIPLAGLSLYIPRWFGVPPLVLLETGTSMPTGLYVYDHALPAAPGEVVVLAKAPHWGRAYLMKRVMGRGGDVFCWDERRQAQRLNGRLLPGPSPRALELGVPVWKECRALGADEYVGFGEGADSYDSRYFGPSPAVVIYGVYRLAWALRLRPAERALSRR